MTRTGTSEVAPATIARPGAWRAQVARRQAPPSVGSEARAAARSHETVHRTRPAATSSTERVGRAPFQASVARARHVAPARRSENASVQRGMSRSDSSMVRRLGRVNALARPAWAPRVAAPRRTARTTARPGSSILGALPKSPRTRAKKTNRTSPTRPVREPATSAVVSACRQPRRANRSEARTHPSTSPSVMCHPKILGWEYASRGRPVHLDGG